jgi:hypothetical protein
VKHRVQDHCIVTLIGPELVNVGWSQGKPSKSSQVSVNRIDVGETVGAGPVTWMHPHAASSGGRLIQQKRDVLDTYT